MKRTIWIAAGLLLSSLSIFDVAHAGPTPVPPSVCAAVDTVPAPRWTTGGTCGAAFCSDDQQCWTNCPDALTAACVGGVCQYTFSGNPGSGNDCPEQRFCLDDSNCVYGTLQGSCQSGVCRC